MDTDNQIFNPADFFSICTEAGYVINFQKRCFSYVADRNLFLCGHSQKEAMEQGYDFYSQIVHNNDLPLFPKIYEAIVNSSYIAEKQEDIDYFSFILRFKINSQYTERPYYLWVVHRLKLVFAEGKLVSGVCLMNLSVMKMSGHLRAYFKGDRYSFDEYSFTGRRWQKKHIEHLTERELKILRLIKGGLDSKAIKDELLIKIKTLYNAYTLLCMKLHLKTIEQAVVYSTNHLMLFDSTQVPIKNKRKTACKRHYHELDQERLKRIQECLDNEQSVNSIAREERVSESGLRRLIRKGVLVKRPAKKS
jgi:DNA-binding CsgD family transcriptional regulator